jgi:hypothetical protein
MKANGAAWRRRADFLVAWRKRRRAVEPVLHRRRTRSCSDGNYRLGCAASVSLSLYGLGEWLIGVPVMVLKASPSLSVQALDLRLEKLPALGA